MGLYRMASLSCSTCGKEFSKKAALDRHGARKIPCKAPTQLIANSVHEALKEAGVEHLEAPLQEFRDSSKKFHVSLSKEVRSEHGIFFTPKKARDLLFEKLAALGVKPKVVLEPSFGSGEFLLDARRIYPEAKILGVELNQSLFDSVKCSEAELTCCDFLTWKGEADLIIGNPPYFIMKTDEISPKEKKEFAQKNAACMTQRPNMYVKFLCKCLDEHLTDGGHLAFIIPTSLYNCSYYQPMRNYIAEHTTIEWLETLVKPGFHDTTQETMLIILKKEKGMGANKFIFQSASGNTYISPFYKELHELSKGAKTIRDLGLKVKTGNIVWNQVKENLSDEGRLLIYSSNIQNSELVLNNLNGDVKKQYVKEISKPSLDGPVILVGRGYGNSFHFNFALVNLKGFYAENHVNVIYPVTSEGVKNLERVAKSFRDERCLKFVESFFGNGSISATELETIIPIF